MPDVPPQFLTRSVADCPYCAEPVMHIQPRGIDHAGRIGHLACLSVRVGECSICAVPLTRQEPRVATERYIAHPDCDQAGRPVARSPVGPVEITDPLTLVMLEVGLQRARMGVNRRIPARVRLNPRFVLELTRLAQAMYRGATLPVVLSVQVVADPEVPHGEVVIEHS